MNELERAEQQLAELAARQWWRWRYHYLESMCQPARAAELRADLSDEQLRLFDETYTSRMVRARMADPNNDAVETEVLGQLITEADEGHVPLNHGKDNYVLLAPPPLVNPFEAVAVRDVGSSIGVFAQQHRIAVVIVASVIVLGLLWAVFRSDVPAQASTTAPTPTPAPTQAAWGILPGPRSSGDPAWPADGPSIRDAAAGLGVPAVLPASIPASLELGGHVYTVRATAVAGGIWQTDPAPGIASWLQDSYVNLVLCLPALPAVDPDTIIQVRDTTGTVKQYTHVQTGTVQRHQIELLSQRSVGLTLIACGGTGETRPVLTATYQP